MGLVFSFSTLSTVEASADDDMKRAAARTLATDGLRAVEAERWEEGLELFERAEALIHAPTHLLYIARANVELGKLVRANEAYMKILREPLNLKAPKAFLEARRTAVDEQAALAPRLPKITILVSGEHKSEATVTIGREVVARELVGVAFPIDPGKHVLVATAPGWASDEMEVSLSEGASETVTLELKRKPSSVAPLPEAVESPTPNETSSSKFSPLTWVAFGVGAAGIGAGTFFLIQNRTKHDDANALCGDGRCPAARREEIESLDSEAKSAATFAWIGYGVGAAGVIAGTTLLFLGRSSSSSSSKAGVMPWVGGRSAGVVGRF